MPSKFPAHIPNVWNQFRKQLFAKFPKYNSSETWFINVYGGLGDVLPVLCHLKEFRKHHGVVYLGLICRTQLRELLSFFTEDYDFIAYLDEDFVPPNNMRVEFGPNELICPSKKYVHGGFWHDFAVSNRVPLFDWYKLGLRVPMSSKLSFPTSKILEGKNTVLNKFQNIDFGKSILLFPFTNFGPRLDSEVWESIVKTCNSSGFKVFTNVMNASSTKLSMGQKNKIETEYHPIQGSEALVLGLADLIYVADQFYSCISGSGGIAFLLGLVEAKVKILYHDSKRPAKFFNSTAPDEFWTHLDMFDAVKRNLPDRDNIAEHLVDNTFLSSISERLFCNVEKR